MPNAAAVTRITCIGLPGSGKSSVGRQLARRLNLPFFDTDHVIEERAGASIRDLFEQGGEAAFRDMEESVIDELTLGGACVLSTGGGAVLRANNRACLHNRAFAVYLHSTPDEVFRRLRHDRTRPLLQVADPLTRLRDLYDTRDGLYRSVAHLIVETGRPSVSALTHHILDELERVGALPN